MLRENLQILFFIKKAKLLKNGEAPIFVRITVDNDRIEFAIKKSILPKLWDTKNRRVKGMTKNAYELNQLLEKYERRITSISELLHLDGEEVTPRKIQEKLIGKVKNRHTLLKLYKDHNEKAKKLEGIDFAPNTILRYETSYMHTEQFIKKYYKRDDVALSEVNYQFIKDFEMYFKVDRKSAHNTVVKYMKNIKKIIGIALANGWMKENPFKSIKFTWEDVDTVYLEEEELEEIRNKKFKNKRIDRVKDVFVFCCFTGLAFADVKSLCKADIVNRNGKMWIIKERQKTKQESLIPLLPAAKAIINKYADEPDLQEKGVLLPVLSNQKMNNYLKEIVDLCGINKDISTHSARHTFATTVTLSNGISIEAVSKMLGHTSLEMTKRYARIREKLIECNMEKIEHLY